MKAKKGKGGKLRIGDDWNAITIIALSQSNPLKAVAEFVENSIDARARNITIIRGKEKGAPYLRVKDDGEGIPRNKEGQPNFDYVATHICDSVKRRLKADGAKGLQGEFGIGLLSFWTLGEELTLTCSDPDGQVHQMQMRRGDPDYQIKRRRVLVSEPGTELVVKKVLPGIRHFSGEKLQWYLASELRDRIRSSGVNIRIIDRTARAELRVEPRQFDGRLLHHLSESKPDGSGLYLELYLCDPAPENRVSLYRSGTRVLENLADLEMFKKAPWTSGYLQGLVDAPRLNLTPGTRLGVIHDEALDELARQLSQAESELLESIDAQKRAEEERASRTVLRSIQSALREALMALPAEEYDWFNLNSGKARVRPSQEGSAGEESKAESAKQSDGDAIDSMTANTDSGEDSEEPAQKEFFEHAGPLFSVKISPSSSVLSVNAERTFAAVARDRSRRRVENDVEFGWSIVEGQGSLKGDDGEIVSFQAPEEPGLVRLKLAAKQGALSCEAEALVTVTDTLLNAPPAGDRQAKGVPGYTFEKAPGELWRSRYDAERNVVVINNGHRDFVYASRTKALKLRYLCRLYVKELVLKNFVGASSPELLERLIELSLYTEENLR